MGKTRTVYFYSGVEVYNNNHPHVWSESRWRQLIQAVMGSAETFEIKGRKLTGTCVDCKAPAIRSLHLMRERPLPDWPEAGDTEGNVANLALRRTQTGISSILEYAYILPVAGTSYVAVFRSSGGPFPTAIAEWVALQSNMATAGSSFSLNPVLRANAREKLDSALGVKKLNVRFEGVPEGKGSDIDQAVADAGRIVGKDDYANATIEFTISLGRGKIIGPATDGIRKALNELLANSILDQYGNGVKGRIKRLWQRPFSRPKVIKPRRKT